MSNQNEYGSLLDTFMALDCYNLPMPVVPPADLTIAAGGIASAFLSVRNSGTSKVVGFDPNDNPYLRSVGISSNYADGLVDASTLHQGNSTPSWQLGVRPVRMAAPLTGTSSIALNAVVGVGTVFLQEVAVGMQISWQDANSVLRTATILTVTDDFNLVLTANIATTGMFTGASNAKIIVPYDVLPASAGLTLPVPIMNTQFSFNAFLLAPGAVTPPEGKITVTAGSAAVVGVGTSFIKYFSALGTCINPIIAYIDNTGIRRTVAVDTSLPITDTTLTLTTVAIAPSAGTLVPMLDIDTSIRVLVSWPAAFLAYTISIDPAYGQANRRLSIHAICEIEHTFPLVKTVIQ